MVEIYGVEGDSQSNTGAATGSALFAGHTKKGIEEIFQGLLGNPRAIVRYNYPGHGLAVAALDGLGNLHMVPIGRKTQCIAYDIFDGTMDQSAIGRQGDGLLKAGSNGKCPGLPLEISVVYNATNQFFQTKGF